MRKQLVDIAIDLWCKGPFSGNSGLVFAGFGRSDLFPCIRAYECDGVLLNHPVFWAGAEGSVDRFNRALVLGFAQADMIQLFMEGVTPQYETFVESYFERVVSSLDQVVAQALPKKRVTPALARDLEQRRDALLASLRQDLQEHRHRLYVDPVISVVASLPKEELGLMAESLVNLTSLKRRVSFDDETVGGPVDVAVISRGDGLIWVKRKHYFDPALNHQFFANYYRSPDV
jgi:hypothetical protein